MKSEPMGQQTIIDHLRGLKLVPITRRENARLTISEKIIRCENGDTLIAAMGCDMAKDDQIHLVVDAVNLWLQTEPRKRFLRLVFGNREDKKEQDEVENAVALMMENIVGIQLKIETRVNDERRDFISKSFIEQGDGRIERWMDFISTERELPALAKDLEMAIHANDGLFQWYRSVTGKYWSGRVGGLEVCTVDLAGQGGVLKVGKMGKNGNNGIARQEFHKILKSKNFNEGRFYRPQLEKVASVIHEIADSRRRGKLNGVQREHLLESQVLSEKVKIIAKEGELESVCKERPFQFPTLWEPSAKPRFMDALMRHGDIPYVVELKEPSGSSIGQGYRHAITQAVLYREFVRKANAVHPWFINKNLDPAKCKAIVAFPELLKSDKKKQMLLRQHILVGNAFGVEIVEIKGFE